MTFLKGNESVMEQIEKKTNKSSANALSNGLSFQFVAAIFTFLEFSKEVEAFGIEGEDDIELHLKNGDQVFCQAKSGLESKSINLRHPREIIDSVNTLCANAAKAKCLIAISNYHNPFWDDNDSFGYHQKYDKKRFADLTELTKQKIRENLINGLQLEDEQLSFWFLRFEGEDRMIPLKDYVNDKLNSLKAVSDLNTNDLVDYWLILVMENGSSKKKLISMNKLKGSLFERSVNGFFSYQASKEATDDFDDDSCDKELVFRRLNDLIDRHALNFDIYNTIRSDYVSWRNCDSNNKKLNVFVEEYISKKGVPNYISVIFQNNDDSVCLSKFMYSLFISFVIHKRDVITKVREIFGDEN